MDICRTQRPPLRHFEDGTQSLCWLETKASETPAAVAATPEVSEQVVSADDPIISVKDVRLTYGGRSLFTSKPGTITEVMAEAEQHIRNTPTLMGYHL